MTGRWDVVLASASASRQMLLREAGIEVRVQRPDIDDGLLKPGIVAPHQWVMALAYLKAHRVRTLLEDARECIILAADTVCVHDGQIIGKPRDANHARWMLMSMCDDVHTTLSGVCLLDRHTSSRILFYDASRVRIGTLMTEQLEAYLQSGNWRSKAGGYNLSEQIEAGWPIQCEGDPTTVVGLPMQRLKPLLASIGVIAH